MAVGMMGTICRSVMCMRSAPGNTYHAVHKHVLTRLASCFDTIQTEIYRQHGQRDHKDNEALRRAELPLPWLTLLRMEWSHIQQPTSLKSEEYNQETEIVRLGSRKFLEVGKKK